MQWQSEARVDASRSWSCRIDFSTFTSTRDFKARYDSACTRQGDPSHSVFEKLVAPSSNRTGRSRRDSLKFGGQNGNRIRQVSFHSPFPFAFNGSLTGLECSNTSKPIPYDTVSSELTSSPEQPQVMNAFYRRLFPYRPFFLWLNQDHGMSCLL
jgi:hypothetical protein